MENMPANNIESSFDLRKQKEEIFAKLDKLRDPAEAIIRKKRGVVDEAERNRLKEEWEKVMQEIAPEADKLKDELSNLNNRIVAATRRELIMDYRKINARRDELYAYLNNLPAGSVEAIKAEKDIEEMERQLIDSIKTLAAEGGE